MIRINHVSRSLKQCSHTSLLSAIPSKSSRSAIPHCRLLLSSSSRRGGTGRTSSTVVHSTTQQQQQQLSWFQWYSQRLDSHPISTKCLSAGLIATIGNLLAQTIDHRQKAQANDDSQPLEIDWGKVGRFTFLNMAFVAPVLHHWYQFVNKAVPGTHMKAVLSRVFWDEFVFTPLYLPVFMGSLWSLEGNSWEANKKMLWKELPQIIVFEWMLWVPTMAVTFRYAPVKYQVLVINVIGVVWQTFLSLIANNAHHDATVVTKDETTPMVVEEAKPKAAQPIHKRWAMTSSWTGFSPIGGGQPMVTALQQQKQQHDTIATSPASSMSR